MFWENLQRTWAFVCADFGVTLLTVERGKPKLVMVGSQCADGDWEPMLTRAANNNRKWR